MVHEDPVRPPREVEVAEQFGPYQLLEPLGHGAMGEVWRAFDRRRGRAVALKRLAGRWAGVPEFRERFRQEARATARLGSPHVIPIHDFGEIDGRLYIDMRLVRDGDLATMIGGGSAGLSSDLAVDLLSQIASALDAAHRDGLVHRDVKPSNVLIDRDESHPLAYLSDFGIAKVADRTTGNPTVTGVTLGTPAYMAPELFVDSRRASVGSDVYALGCLFFEMLTGHTPFAASDVHGFMGRHLLETPPAPSLDRPELAPFDEPVRRALAKEPENRQPSAGTFAAEVLAARDGTPDSRRRVRWPSSSGSGRRRAAAIALVTVVLVVAGVGVGLVVGGLRGRSGEAAAGPAPSPLTAPVEVPVTTHYPEGITFSADGRRAYMANTDSETIAVIDTATSALVSTIRIPGGANSMALSPDGRRAYVASFGSSDQPGSAVSVVDLATDTVTARITVGVAPYGIALSPDGRRAYVTNFGTNAQPGSTLSVIDTTTGTVIGTVPVGLSPTRPVVSPDGRTVYVPFYGADRPGAAGVSIVDTATGATATMPAGDEEPVGAVLSPDGRRLYLATLGPNSSAGGVQVIDTATRTTARLGTDIPGADGGIALSEDGSTLVTANGGVPQRPAHLVAEIDAITGRVRRTVNLPGGPNNAAIRPDTREAWVTTDQPDGLWRVPLT